MIFYEVGTGTYLVIITVLSLDINRTSFPAPAGLDEKKIPVQPVTLKSSPGTPSA
jgi:hypothetical protein